MENKFTNIKDRVVEIAEKQAFTKEEFFSSIGMTSASFRGKARKTPLNSNAIVNIITKYPETDLYWLLKGSVMDENNKRSTLVEEEDEKYIVYNNCSEKDKVIKLLEDQIADLKLDKIDLKMLLGLESK